MKEYTKKYFDMVSIQMKSAIDFENIEKNEEFGQVSFNRLFNLDGPKTANGRHSPKSIFVANKLFYPFSEILDSIYAIDNILLFIKDFPYEKQNISRVQYLRYHIENYLNELYILKNRLISYLKIIERAYKKTDNYSHIETTFKLVYSFISRAFKAYTEIRGLHVHHKRYSDYEISRLSLIELLSRGNSKQEKYLKSYFIIEYKEVQNKWIKKIKDDSLNIHDMLNQYFEQLLLAISEDDKIKYPSNLSLSDDSI